MPGTLYLIATPIGNLEDITLRALRVLGEVDLVACEDTRHTRKLLTHFQINRPTVSYHEHNERERAEELVEKLLAGANIALVSDAGTPLISDPGYRIVRESIDRGIAVVPLPGASALVTALAASGLATSDFVFAGFLPSRSAARRARLSELARFQSTLVFYESPHRIKETIRDALELLGDRESVIARELTKLHEQFMRDRLSGLLSALDGRAIKGEIVLIVGPPPDDGRMQKAPSEPISLLTEVESLMESDGIDQMAALKRVARARGISKSDAYRMLLAEREGNEEEMR
ncbi:MAG TPA: 16S rRNA (cytidine(1402)-2'-O)-methyltransferase [Blastocatellia bacterium]|jgi:16S rRNA (cytidine1402-2'-O)-methyltransferase|nr:16S rRNA (cytidine(1402)-2'-O)-methyltransferase [Blastocatellia bacterium]